MGDDTAALLARLASAGLSVAVAESLTGGQVTAELTRPAGASAVLLGGVVVYATELKHTLLGVDMATLAMHGPVHPDVAVQLAVGVRRRLAVGPLAASIGVSATGVAGPDSQGGRPPGTVYIGVSSDAGSRVIPLVLSGDRAGIRAQVVAEVIAALDAEMIALGFSK